MSGETMVPANGVDLCVETFGEPSDPPVLLVAGGASSMDWWEDEFCRRLAAGGRYVIRYDHRDTGRSTAFPAGAPPYTGADLAADALGLLDALGESRAHVVGVSLGGGIAQRIAIEHPSRLLSVTLMSTAAGTSSDDDGSADDSPPEAGEALEPASQADHFDWSDRAAAVARLAKEAQDAGGPFTASGDQMRRLAERVFDRTTDMAASQTNHWLVSGGPAPRGTLRDVTVPALVMHGTVDPFFPVSEGERLAREIPGARLVLLEGVGHEHPPAAVWSVVIGEILKHSA